MSYHKFKPCEKARILDGPLSGNIGEVIETINEGNIQTIVTVHLEGVGDFKFSPADLEPAAENDVRKVFYYFISYVASGNNSGFNPVFKYGHCIIQITHENLEEICRIISKETGYPEIIITNLQKLSRDEYEMLR